MTSLDANPGIAVDPTWWKHMARSRSRAAPMKGEFLRPDALVQDDLDH